MATKSDIARMAGVSHTCVSQVMNHAAKARISESTRQKVLGIARSLGYVPTPITRGQARSHLIAYILCSPHIGEIIRGYWHFGVLHELQQMTQPDDRFITFLATANHAQSVRESLRAIDIQRPIGVILDGTVPATMVSEMALRNIPTVIAGVTAFAHDAAWREKVSTVSIDVPAIVRQLLTVLHARGSRRIALVSSSAHLMVNQLILQTYREHLAQLGLDYDAALVQIGDEDAALEVFARYERLGIPFDGLLLGNATMAATVATYLRANGQLSLNEQRIAVLGHKESVPANMQNITCCGVSHTIFCAAIYQQLSELIDGGPHKERHVIVEAELHEGIR